MSPKKTQGFNDLIKNIIDKPLEILFAHEEKQIIKLFFQILGDLEKKDKLNLSSAQSGYEIIDKLKEKSFDIIIIDEELPSFDIPKVFDSLRVEHPDAKVLILAKKYNNNLNEFSRIQYCRKPFKFNDLRNKIADLILNPELCAKNILALDIINTIGTLTEKSAIVIQNLACNSSGEMFIDNKRIVQASVESEGTTLQDVQAIEEILSWTDYEGCISKGTPFPDEQLYTISEDIFQFYNFTMDRSKSDQHPRIELSAEAKEELQQYLNLVPYSITDSFVMNAFCTTDCITHASIKDSDYNETLYKISDKIVAIFLKGIGKINAKNENQEILKLSKQFVMVLYKLEKDIWYYAILKDDKALQELNSIVDDFSFDAIQILTEAKSVTKEVA